jgi:hypothetical protein
MQIKKITNTVYKQNMLSKICSAKDAHPMVILRNIMKTKSKDIVATAGLFKRIYS